MRAAIREVRSAALGAIRPGARASEVDPAARAVMERHDFGGSLSARYRPWCGIDAANAHSLPHIHPASPDILEEGMSLNVEHAAYFTGYGGMRHCDLVAIENSRANVLSAW